MQAHGDVPYTYPNPDTETSSKNPDFTCSINMVQFHAYPVRMCIIIFFLYLPLNTGFLFSPNALNASCQSSLANVRSHMAFSVSSLFFSKA